MRRRTKGNELVKTRLIALFCVLGLVASACGSRLSEDELATGGGTGGGGVSQSSGGRGTEGAGIDNSSDQGPKIGSLPVSCGAAPKGETLAAPTAGDPGVTVDTIKIGVITDNVSFIKLPTASIAESVQAFVDFCNGFGGINGRKLELTKLDSKLSEHLAATKAACEGGLFALVGSGAVFDDKGAQAMVDCQLIEVPAYTVTAAKGMSDRVFAPIPNPSDAINIGPAQYVKKQYPEAIRKAAILHGDVPSVTIQADRVKEAYESEGYDFVYDKTTGAIQESYTSEVKAMKDAGVEYLTMVSATDEVVKLLRDMKTQGFAPEIVDLGQQYYDPGLLEEPGSEGAIVQLNTAPFEEAKQSPALAAYLEAYDAVGSDIEATSLGVQAFSAGLLFATAAKAAGPDLSRDKVLAELEKIKEWDGGGLHFQTDPGDNAVSTCFSYAVVKDAKFVRLQPKKVGQFDCSKDYALKLEGDYGTGAKASG